MKQIKIHTDLLKKMCDFKGEYEFNDISDVVGNHKNSLLTYVSDNKYIETVNLNSNILGVICKSEHIKYFNKEKICLVTKDPTFVFFTLLNLISKNIEYFEIYP